MKVRVVLITENNSSVKSLGKDATEKIKVAWELLLKLAEVHSDNGDRGYVESVEIVEE